MYNYYATVTRVVDADTLVVSIDLGFNIRIEETLRLGRINAYETRLGKKTTADMKKKGIEAKEFVEKLFENEKAIEIETTKDVKGKFGRYIAEVWYTLFSKRINLNSELVQKGYAVYVEY